MKRIVLHFSRQQRSNLQWKSFPSSYSAAFGFRDLLSTGKAQSPLTYVHSGGSMLMKVKFTRTQLHFLPLFSVVHCHKCHDQNMLLSFYLASSRMLLSFHCA